jgi:endonuclease/exonuclease/phosphatase family metal-dependent hydrolase
MGAARVIKEQLDSYSDEIPTILMGDFNATPETLCYKWLTGQEVDGEVGPCFSETFTPPYPGTLHRFTGKPTGDYIDWILFRGPLRLHRCHVLQEPIEGVYPSDHFPVGADFELQ